MKLFIISALFVVLIIFGTAYGMLHTLPTVDTHAVITATCNAVASLCTGK